MVKKLSNAMSGKTATNAGFRPDAFQDELSALLYQDPEDDSRINMLSWSPDTEER